MPLTTITVEAVQTFTGSGVWTVNGFDAEQHFHGFTTNRPWVAALCDRARLQAQPVEIGWRESRRFGQDIVTVRVEDSRAQEGAA